MKKLRLILNTILLVLALGTLAPQFAQDASPAPENLDPRSRPMFELVRAINTAEVCEEAAYGSFASWQTLLAHQQKYLNEWLAKFYSRDPNVHFGSTSEILPGWNLRLTVQSDGSGWVIMLQDPNEKNGYALLSDERGIIWKCNPFQW